MGRYDSCSHFPPTQNYIMFYENTISEPTPSHFQVGWEITSDHIYLWSPLNDFAQNFFFLSNWLAPQAAWSFTLGNWDCFHSTGCLLAAGRSAEPSGACWGKRVLVCAAFCPERWRWEDSGPAWGGVSSAPLSLSSLLQCSERFS